MKESLFFKQSFQLPNCFKLKKIYYRNCFSRKNFITNFFRYGVKLRQRSVSQWNLWTNHILYSYAL